jgi:hypothetical protein
MDGGLGRGGHRRGYSSILQGSVRNKEEFYNAEIFKKWIIKKISRYRDVIILCLGIGSTGPGYVKPDIVDPCRERM